MESHVVVGDNIDSIQSLTMTDIIKIFNIYATPDVGAYQTKFYKEFTEKLGKITDQTIICGDFNCVINKIDAKNNNNFKMTPAAKYGKTLQKFIN